MAALRRTVGDWAEPVIRSLLAWAGGVGLDVWFGQGTKAGTLNVGLTRRPGDEAALGDALRMSGSRRLLDRLAHHLSWVDRHGEGVYWLAVLVTWSLPVVGTLGATLVFFWMAA